MPQIGADLVGDLVTQQLPSPPPVALVASGGDEQVGLLDPAVLHQSAFGHEALDVFELQQPDLASTIRSEPPQLR